MIEVLRRVLLRCHGIVKAQVKYAGNCKTTPVKFIRIAVFKKIENGFLSVSIFRKEGEKTLPKGDLVCVELSDTRETGMPFPK